jgi:hypothetical protein
MATLTWYTYKVGDQYAYITVDYSEKIYKDYSTITVDNIKYYNSYTSDTNSSGKIIKWSGLTLQITGSFGTHTVVNGMTFYGCSNTPIDTSINATTPNIETGTSVSFVLSGTIDDDGTVNRSPQTVGGVNGSSNTTQVISMHSHSWSSSVTKQPTCTETGVRTYTCTTCNNSYKESMPTLSHVWSGGFVTKPPTYEAVGTRTYTCRTCGGTRTEQIDKLPATIYIDNGSGFDGYGVYIDNGSSWDAYAVYIDDGEKFIAYC